MKKVTPWFSNTVQPARIGRYEVRNNAPAPRNQELVGSSFRYWDGKHWLAWEGAYRSIMGRHHTHEWRGLARRPSKG